MLICRLEMQPEFDAAPAYLVGEIRIGQSGGDCFVADYKIEMDKASRQARTPGIWRTADVLAFDHSQLGPYDLLLRALIACLGGRSHAAVSGISPGAAIFSETEDEQQAA